MSLPQHVNALLRFLTQDAKVPLAQAMGKIKPLQAAKLNTALDLAKADFETLEQIFGDEKAARQCLNAAKRVSKKRGADDEAAPLPAKKTRPIHGQPLNGAQLEASLALPEPDMDEKVLRATVLYTNRAPLVLAFAVTLIKYTMPEQPVSSRLSLAQAVTSMNSKAKAVHIGLDKGQPAEEQGWGEGQPLVRIMTRDVRVMKRWGYEWEEETVQTPASSPDTVVDEKAKAPALWGVDLEALKKANQPGASGLSRGQNNMPIYTAQSARAYLLKAFDTPEDEVEQDIKHAKKPAVLAAQKQRNLGLLLGALELLFQSWAQILSKDDVDKRAWAWYVRVRPDVAQGAAGWGGKGKVRLADILDLQRPAEQVP
ncbi:hypothetical protein ACJQWK_04423 [Exserohilum turcicum]|uniref:Impact N-terminal domain-containing protein n=1 Tax=Exserohilum turcicum (strain 28A) TaxID=671987 RepID=R0JMB4_EXST2|nr:uncharacterized protein SETTUDRAFT_140445 [Exserohilum turcica Et28A]EOA82388.1 hypothetical protein SETTUDRAFT_140445 [Exserohilum turcica Et28A]